MKCLWLFSPLEGGNELGWGVLAEAAAEREVLCILCWL